MSTDTSDITIGQAMGRFIDSIAAERNTGRTYAAGLASFAHFIEERHGREATSLAALDCDVLEGFQSYLIEREYSRFTVRTYMAALSAFLTYLVAHDMLPPGFSLTKARARLRHTRRGAPYPAPVPDPALPRIIRYYDEMPPASGDGRAERTARLTLLRSRAVVHTLYSSAGRIAEVASLDRRDVADGRNSEVIVTGKGNKQRFIYLTAEAQRAIRAYVRERADTHPPLFVSHANPLGRRLSKVSLWQTVKAAAQALRIDVSPHDFRHYRARQMLEQGAPLEAIQEILGHSDISTTRKVYAIYSRRAVRDIFAGATLSPDEALRDLEDDD